MSVRILWQSSTVLSSHPAYLDALRAHADERVAQGTRVEWRGVQRTPGDSRVRAQERRNALALFDAAARAQEEGFDALAVGCFLDPMLDALKETLDIPVLGLAESALHAACMLGRRFAVISHSAQLNAKYHAPLIEKYGLAGRAARLLAVEAPLPALEAALRGDAGDILGRLREAGREAVASGAEVIVVGCGLMNLAAVRHGLAEIDGAPVLDATGVLLKLAESAAVLARRSGWRSARTGSLGRSGC